MTNDQCPMSISHFLTPNAQRLTPDRAGIMAEIPGEHSMNPRDRIIVALDVDNADSALRLVELLNSLVGAFKVGLELLNSTGPEIFKTLHEAGVERVFYDAKIHDIPNT